MELQYECLPCMSKALTKLAQRVSDSKSIQQDIISYGMKLIGDKAFCQSTPYITAQIYDYAKKASGNDDPYRDEKIEFNQIAEKLIGELDLQKRIMESHDPLETAVRLSIAGNIIDYSLGNDIEESGVRTSIENSLRADLYGMDMKAFRESVDKAERIMVISDNAGEIVFDKLLIERLPREKVVYAVKGGAIVNDATMEDAVMTGMCDLVEVIDNGTAIQGTVLSVCSKTYIEAFNASDLIISKGQANFETLDDVQDKNIFFLLRAKCSVVAREVGCSQMDFVFMNKKNK